MNAILHHFAVRLWLSAILGSLLSILWLPLWQRFLGIGGLWLPAAGTLALAFTAAGWSMNRIGLWLLHRQMREAAVWERAGRNRQARRAYDRLSALFGGFWLSPRKRKRTEVLAAGQMIRFHLAQPELSLQDRRSVAAYFQHNPRDAAAAERWLEHLLEQDQHSAAEHEAAVRVGDSLADQAAIQRLLFQFYLLSGRIDFSALQTYRRVWRAGQELPAEETVRLARLLAAESLLNDWALEVYLKAYAAGARECLDGIRAAVRMLHPSSANRLNLEQARAICAAARAPGAAAPAIDRSPTPPIPQIVEAHQPAPMQADPAGPARASQSRAHLASGEAALHNRSESAEAPSESEPEWRFQSGPADGAPEAEDIPALLDQSSRMPGLLGKACVQCGQAAGDLGRLLAGAARRLAIALRRGPSTSKFKSPGRLAFRKTAALTVLAVVIVGAGISVWRHLDDRQPAELVPAGVSSAPPAPPADPFTIQVAAYLRAEDAVRFTERLKKNGLDAYFSMATSANRKWYQVKVSHFPTRAQAREYGEQLKAKGLIDDFYVSNYQPGDILP